MNFGSRSGDVTANSLVVAALCCLIEDDANKGLPDRALNNIVFCDNRESKIELLKQATVKPILFMAARRYLESSDRSYEE